MYPIIERDRFLIPAAPLAVACAIEAVKVLCEKHAGDALICMPVLRHADSTFLNDVWPEEQIRQLAQGRSLLITDKRRVSMCSPFNLKKVNLRDKVVALGLFASPDMISKMEKYLFACRALVVVPWTADDAEGWQKKYKPRVIHAPAKDGHHSAPG